MLPYYFIKKRLQQRSFPVNIATSLKNSFFYRTPPVAASVDMSISCFIKCLFIVAWITVGKNPLKLVNKIQDYNLTLCSRDFLLNLSNILIYRFGS